MLKTYCDDDIAGTNGGPKMTQNYLKYNFYILKNLLKSLLNFSIFMLILILIYFNKMPVVLPAKLFPVVVKT